MISSVINSWVKLFRLRKGLQWKLTRINSLFLSLKVGGPQPKTQILNFDLLEVTQVTKFLEAIKI